MKGVVVHDYLLGTTELGNVALAHVGGKDSIDSFSELIGVIRVKCGDPIAGLFAEPVRNPARPGKPLVVTWYAAFEGAAVPLCSGHGAVYAQRRGVRKTVRFTNNNTESYS